MPGSNELSVRAVTRLVRSGSVSVTDVINECCRAIEDKNSDLKALRCYSQELAAQQAQLYLSNHSTTKLGERLRGAVFSVKDHINVAGFPRSEGSALGARDKDSFASRAVQKLLDEGAVCIGKGNMAEYGKSYETNSPAFGRTVNPFDPTRSPGGSGGGDAAAIAAGLCHFGLGIDAGGSVRVPASYCGLFGLYSTPGLISFAGIEAYPQTSSQLFRSLGPLARSLDDLEIVFRVLLGYDPEDPYSLPEPAYSAEQTPLRKIAWFDSIGGTPCDAETKAALMDTVGLLENAGFELEQYEPEMFRPTLEPFIVLGVQFGNFSEDRISEASRHPRDPRQEGPEMQRLRQRLASDLPPLSPETIQSSWHAVTLLRREAARLFSRYAALLSPVSAVVAPPHGTSEFEIEGKRFETHQVFHFASVANFLGLPALAFPTKVKVGSVPVGLQLIGPRCCDLRLFHILRETEVCDLGCSAPA